MSAHGFRVLGLDLSLSNTGVAVAGDDGAEVWRITPKDLPPKTKAYDMLRLRRIRYIVNEIESMLRLRTGIGLVVIEGLFQGGRVQAGIGERAWLAGRTRDLFYDHGIPVAHMEPSQVKTYATGKGIGDKDQVLAAVIRRYPDVPVSSNDEADALVLAAAGRDHIGRPLVTVPETHRRTLARTIWPVLDVTPSENSR